MITFLQPFQSFIDQAIDVIRQDAETVGLAAGGSWALAVCHGVSGE